MNEDKLGKLDNILNSLKYAIESTESVEAQLHNALLSFNGILLTAFSIMVALNPKSYAPYLTAYFMFTFITIALLIAKLYQIRQNFFDTILEKQSELAEAFPQKYKKPKQANTNKEKWQQKWSGNKIFFIMDKAVICFSLANPIVLFLIIKQAISS